MSHQANHPGQRSGPRSRLCVGVLLGLLVALLGPLVAGAPAYAEDPVEPETAESSPLTVHLVRLTPAAIPTKGRLVLAGTVTNDSDETWSAINVDPFISRNPMTSRDELAAAARTEETAEVGARLTGVGQFDPIGDLDPGQSSPFRISLPIKDLIGPAITGSPGVYWVGVHALGQNADGRDTLADGRARTFIPLVRPSKSAQQTPVAVVIPVRERVRRDREGRVLSSTAWAQTLAPTGRLGRLAGILEAAGTIPTSLLIDPAVLEAVDDLKNQNPAVSLGIDPEAEPAPTSSPSRDSNRLEPADLVNATNWLTSVVGTARRQTTLGLAYGDPDANALARRRARMLTLANQISTQTFDEFGITARPTVAPPAGWFDEDLLPALAQNTMVLLSDQSATRIRTRWKTTSGQSLVFSDAQAAQGGPGPSTPTDALALRQRILADAALRLPSRSTSPMVVQLPDDWDPGASWQLADFFNSLNQPWVRMVPLTDSDLSVDPEFTASLPYPRAAQRTEVPAINIGTARNLIQLTTVLVKTLLTTNTLVQDLPAIALEAVSVHAADDLLTARQHVLATSEQMRSILNQVQVIGTDFVTLSGGSGSLAVTLVNGLDHPIMVGLEPQTTNQGVKIDSVEPFEMAAGQRTVLRLDATSSGIGIDQIRLTPVTVDGTPFGTALTFRLRTSQVGNLIWAVLGAGGLLLVVMIGRRIRVGLRDHQWRRG